MNPIREALKNLPGHWMKGDYTDENGNYCGVGYLALALGFDAREFPLSDTDHNDFWNACNLLSDIVIEQYPDKYYCDYVDFNDDEDTTEQKVVAVFEKGAVKWDEQV